MIPAAAASTIPSPLPAMSITPVAFSARTMSRGVSTGNAATGGGSAAFGGVPSATSSMRGSFGIAMFGTGSPNVFGVAETGRRLHLGPEVARAAACGSARTADRIEG